MPVAQLNVRFDENLKAAGDAVLRRNGVPAVQVIRDMWKYMADHQAIPRFDMVNASASSSHEAKESAQHRIEEGAGMVSRYAKEAGIRADFESMTFEELREAAFEEMLLEKEELHA